MKFKFYRKSRVHDWSNSSGFGLVNYFCTLYGLVKQEESTTSELKDRRENSDFHEVVNCSLSTLTGVLLSTQSTL